MPEQTDIGSPQNPESSDFVKKPIETPILDSDVKNHLASMGQSRGGFKGFYRSNKLYFWAILAAAVVIGLLSYFAFKKSPQAAPKEANIAISVDVPPTAQSGGQAVYQITIQNNDTQKLVDMQLELAYPDGETYQSSSPNAQNLSGTLFAVPDLIPGQNATVFLKTAVTGNVNDQETLDIKLHYSYSNFNSEFVKEQTSTIRLVASNINLTLQGPSDTSNAQLVIYTINYQNNSSNAISGARVQMDYPDGFVFAAATPPPDLGSNSWDIASLAKGGSGQIQVQGTFSSANPGDSKTATAEFLILAPDGSFYTQNSASLTTSIASLPLLVTQALNPANTIGVVNPGDTLNFNITYQNNSSVAATGVNVEVDLNSKAINPSTISAQGAQINNDTIIWNAAAVPQLASLLPNQSGQLSFSVKVNNPATKDASTNLTVVSNIKIQSNEYTTAFPGNQLTLQISSPASINTNVTYVSGALPPQVGKNTIYQITLSLANSSNSFSSGVLTAFLPSASFIVGSVSSAETAGTQFDPSTSMLTWNFGSLSANTGRFGPPRILSFDVTLNPASSAAGQAPTLLKTIAVTATDLFTNQPVTLTAPDILTSDLQTQNGFGDGVVQQ